jgi:hypothetical protein
MDASEAIAKKLLVHMGFTSVVYEPDGNIPPDFVADGRVAVEVRRLNQNHDSGDGKRGLEEDAIPLRQKVERLIESLGPAVSESWFVSFHFSRPIKPWKELEPKLKAALIAFQQQSTRSGGPIYTIYSDRNFELELLKASKTHPTYFLLGSSSDQQSGGFIVAEMLTNIEHCTNEKSKKIANFKSKYSEWWLVLVDLIGLGLDDYNKQQFLTYAKRPEDWNKIVVVNPRDPSRWIEY